MQSRKAELDRLELIFREQRAQTAARNRTNQQLHPEGVPRRVDDFGFGLHRKRLGPRRNECSLLRSAPVHRCNAISEAELDKDLTFRPSTSSGIHFRQKMPKRDFDLGGSPPSTDTFGPVYRRSMDAAAIRRQLVADANKNRKPIVLAKKPASRPKTKATLGAYRAPAVLYSPTWPEERKSTNDLWLNRATAMRKSVITTEFTPSVKLPPKNLPMESRDIVVLPFVVDTPVSKDVDFIT